MLLTIGHSTRPAAEFVSMLKAHAVTGVADVRAVPRSRRHPHFSREPLRALLHSHGIAYLHVPGLGGHRQPRPDSTNGGWRDGAFRGYADHMAGAEFVNALGEVLTFAEKYLVALMCAESQWRQCHRQLIADALVVRGIDVRHIVSVNEPERHELTLFARVVDRVVQYPSLV